MVLPPALQSSLHRCGTPTRPGCAFCKSARTKATCQYAPLAEGSSENLDPIQRRFIAFGADRINSWPVWLRSEWDLPLPAPGAAGNAPPLRIGGGKESP